MSTVYNKKYFTDLLEKLVLPLKEHYSEECANLYLGHTGAAFEDRTIPMQGFSRVLWGLVPLWAGGENIEDFSEIYTKGLSAGFLIFVTGLRRLDIVSSWLRVSIRSEIYFDISTSQYHSRVARSGFL